MQKSKYYWQRGKVEVGNFQRSIHIRYDRKKELSHHIWYIVLYQKLKKVLHKCICSILSCGNPFEKLFWRKSFSEIESDIENVCNNFDMFPTCKFHIKNFEMGMNLTYTRESSYFLFYFWNQIHSSCYIIYLLYSNLFLLHIHTICNNHHGRQ